MLENLTDRARKIIHIAKTAANPGHIGPVHILIGMAYEPRSIAGTVLIDCGIAVHNIRLAMASTSAWHCEPPNNFLESLIEKAEQVRTADYIKYIGTEHLLLALVQMPETMLLLHELNIYPAEITRKTLRFIGIDQTVVNDNDNDPLQSFVYCT